MNLFNDRWLRDIQQIVVPLEILLPVLEPLSPKSCLIQFSLLDIVPMAPSKTRMRSCRSAAMELSCDIGMITLWNHWKVIDLPFAIILEGHQTGQADNLP